MKQVDRVQAEIAEDYSVSQPSIIRAISAITPLLVNVLLEYVPTADYLDPGTCYLADGTLLPCWSWRAHPELYSGKHKTTCMNVQVACTIDGRLAWISDPIPGSRHDNHCLGESGVLDALDPRNWTGDKDYVGSDMITPFKKPIGGEFLTGRKSSTSRSTRSATLSNTSLPTLRPGGSRTPITADLLRRFRKPSQSW
jgi:DDE superfamily endonuclease